MPTSCVRRPVLLIQEARIGLFTRADPRRNEDKHSGGRGRLAIFPWLSVSGERESEVAASGVAAEYPEAKV